MKDQDIIFEIESKQKNVPNFQIKTNSIYKLTDKLDVNAPSGFIKEGTKKLPSHGVGDTIQAKYEEDRVHPDGGIWDTGLYVDSPCYRHQKKDKVKEIVDKLQKHIVDGYKKIYSRTQDLSHEDDSFWEKKKVFLYSGKAFNTADVNDLLELYIAVQTGSATPQGFEGDPVYEESSYVVVDYAKNTEYKKLKASTHMDAFMLFGNLLSTNKKKLHNVLFYEGLNITSSMDDETLKYTFNEYLSKKPKNADNFNKLVESLKDDEKAENKLFIYKKLKTLFIESNLVTKKSNGNFSYKDQIIGSDLKAAAEDITYNDKFKEIKAELLIG